MGFAALHQLENFTIEVAEQLSEMALGLRKSLDLGAILAAIATGMVNARMGKYLGQVPNNGFANDLENNLSTGLVDAGITSAFTFTPPNLDYVVGQAIGASVGREIVGDLDTRYGVLADNEHAAAEAANSDPTQMSLTINANNPPVSAANNDPTQTSLTIDPTDPVAFTATPTTTNSSTTSLATASTTAAVSAVTGNNPAPSAGQIAFGSGGMALAQAGMSTASSFSVATNSNSFFNSGAPTPTPTPTPAPAASSTPPSLLNRVENSVENGVYTFFAQHPVALDVLTTLGNIGNSQAVSGIANLGSAASVGDSDAQNFTTRSTANLNIEEKVSYYGAYALGTATTAVGLVEGGMALMSGITSLMSRFGLLGGDLTSSTLNAASAISRRDYLNAQFGRSGSLDEDINYRGYTSVVPTLDFSTGPSQAVFYSGNNGLNQTMARIYARNTGGYVIETTPGGQWLNQQSVFSRMPRDMAADVWSAASARYAYDAQGEVTAFAQNADPARTFLSTELPILRANTNVTAIINMNELPSEQTEQLELALQNRMQFRP